MEMQPVTGPSAQRVQQYFTMIFVPPEPGGTVTRAGRFPGFEVQLRGSRGSQPVWFGPALHAAVSSRWICVGYSKKYEISCFDHAGLLTTRIERAYTPRRVTDREREFATSWVRSRIPKAPPAMRAGLEASIKLYVYADRLPAFGAFLAASTGELWVREFDNTDALRGQSGRGEWLADVSLPPRFVPFDVGRDYVAGVSRDADDVEHVTVLRLRR
jgi:hypothetical protein